MTNLDILSVHEVSSQVNSFEQSDYNHYDDNGEREERDF